MLGMKIKAILDNSVCSISKIDDSTMTIVLGLFLNKYHGFGLDKE